MRRAAPLLLLVLPLLASVALARPAAAEEDAGASALERLTEAERATLEARVPGWAELDAAKQERIARGVIRLRSLSPEERRRLERRLGALERHRRVHGRLPGGLDELRERPGLRGELRRRGYAVKALGAVLWPALPEALRTEAEEALSPREREAVERAFFHRLWTLRVEKLAEAGVPAVDVPAEEGTPRAERLADLRRRAEEGNERARRILAHLALAQGVERLTAGLGDEAPDAATLARLGARVRDADPVAFAAALGEVTGVLGDPEARADWLARARPGTGPASGGGRGRGPGRGRGREELRRLEEALERAWPLLQGDPALRRPAEALRRALEARR